MVGNAPVIQTEAYFSGYNDEIIVTATKRQATREEFDDFRGFLQNV